MVSPVPEGYSTVTPYIIVRGAAKAVEFYKRAFDAVEIDCMLGPGGKTVMHAEIRIGNSIIMLSDENPDWQTTSPQTLGNVTGSLHLYVDDVDAAMKKAIDAGATLKFPVTNMFWGDRYGKIVDPFGHMWGLATHIEDVTPKEMSKRAELWLAEMAKQKV